MTLPRSTAATTVRKLARIQLGSGFQVGIGAGDNANIHSVQQAAQPRYQQEEPVVTSLFVVRHGGCPFAEPEKPKSYSSREYYGKLLKLNLFGRGVRLRHAPSRETIMALL